MAVPWTPQSYVYVPGVLNTTEYVELDALMIPLLAKLGEPVDCMLCELAAFQVHVTVLPAAIVFTAGFWLPFWALRK
jgi:hypothetical protein